MKRDLAAWVQVLGLALIGVGVAGLVNVWAALTVTGALLLGLALLAEWLALGAHKGGDDGPAD